MLEYKCNICDKLLKNKIDYKRHKIKKKPCNKNPLIKGHFECNLCNKTFARKYTLDRHKSDYCLGKTENKKCAKILEISNKHKNTSALIKPNDKFINSDNDIKKNRTKSYLIRTESYPTRTDACESNKKKCEFCDKSISKTNYSKHIRICKEKKENKEKEELYNKANIEKELIFKQLIEKMESLENENKKLKKQITINNNSNNNSNNIIDNSTNNNTINIQLVAYGKEDYNKLTDKDYKIIINKGFKSVTEFVNQLHFDKNRPAIIKSSI